MLCYSKLGFEGLGRRQETRFISFRHYFMSFLTGGEEGGSEIQMLERKICELTDPWRLKS